MNAEILSVGTELLMGQIANTDAQYLSQGLNELGINVYYHTVVGDNPGRLQQQLRQAWERSDLIITTGGLGPTEDDLTKEAVAEFLGLPLELHQPSLEAMARYFAGIGRTMTPNNEKQAYFPKGCLVLDNPNGTAPGCLVEREGRVFVVLPGPPRELNPMFDNHVRPYLMQRGDAKITSRMLHIFGMGESEAAYRLRTMIERQDNPTLATYVGKGDVLLRITARTALDADPEPLLAPAVQEVEALLGGVVISDRDETLPEVVVRLLASQGKTLACAESCTGGLLSSMIVDVPGASGVLLEGAVTYSNEAKMRRLAVPEAVLAQHGAVSEACARAMAEGMRAASGADFALATTGIAGPGGGTPEKPVGLIYAALASAGGVEVETYRLKRDRALNRRTTALNALDMLRRHLLQKQP